MPRFLRGYTTVCSLDPFWLTTIPDFLLFQTLYLWALIHRDHGAQPREPRIQALADRFALRLKRCEPVIDFDFTALAGGMRRSLPVD